MGLFGSSRSKKPGKNEVRTAYGYAPLFTTEEALPDDINKLRGMSYYYRNTKPDERIAHVIHEKLVGMGTGFPYVEYNRYLGIDYFNGNVVPKDIKRGSELFLKWVDWAVEESDASVNLHEAIIQYFNWGYTDCLHLLESLNKRIAKERSENKDPLGMWVYKLIFSIWQYTEVKKYITLKGTHMPYFMEWLQDNMGIDYSYWITKIYARDEGVYFMDTAVEAGNIFAIENRISYYSFRKGDNANEKRHIEHRLKTLQNQQKAIYDALREEAATHDHSKYLQQKALMDEQIKKYADFFKGARVWLPEDYPFYKGEGSIYYSVSEALKAFKQLEKSSIVYSRYSTITSLSEQFVKHIKRLEEQKYLPATYLKILAPGMSLPLLGSVEVPLDGEIRKIYSELVEKGYADAIRLKTECTPEEIPFVRVLRCNPEVTKEYIKELLDKCWEAFQKEDWLGAIHNLYLASEEGDMGRMAIWRDRIVGRAVSLAYDYLNQGKYKESERLAYYGAELGEAYACHIMAILYYNHRGGEFYVEGAWQYLKRCVELRSSTIFDLDDSFYATIEANLRLADETLGKVNEGYRLAPRNHYTTY